MKSTVVNGTYAQDKPYPKLMTSTQNSTVLLAESESNGTICGTVINRGLSNYEVGHYSRIWSAQCLVDFTGSVTLEG